MANSFVRYTGNGSTTAYAIPFSYRVAGDLTVTINGVATTAFTFNAAGTTLTFNTAPANASSIEIRRSTSQASRLTDYSSGSVLTESDLDTDSTQAFFMGQEAIDDAADKIAIDNTDFQWNATSKRIKNVSDPTGNQDVATKNYLENTWLTTANKAALTTINANISNINAVNSNATNINTVAGNTTNINTVATNIANVNTVAADIAKVIIVANDLAEAISEVETVADDLNEATSEIDTVATNVANVNTVGLAITNVNTVAGAIANVNTVAGINANVSTVAGISGNVTSVAGIASNVTAVAGKATEIGLLGTSANITNMATLGATGVVGNIATVAGISGNVTTVAGISSNVTTVAGANANIGTVAGAISNINTVAGANSNITTVAGAVTNINTVASNIAGVNSFADRYRISSSAPTTSLDVGDLYFDTTANELKVYKASGWAAAGSSVNGTSERFHYDITGTPTTVSGADANGNTLAYDAGFVDVFLNGIRMTPADITVTSGTSVVFAQALAAGDDVDIVTYGTFNVAAMNASNLNSGTVPDARITGTYTGLTGLDLTDNSKIRLGTGNDLEIYHDGSNSYIKDTGTGGLVIQANADFYVQSTGSNESFIQAASNAFVKLFYNGSEKLATTSTGIDITGAFTATAASTITTADNTDTLTLTSTDADASVGPNLRLYRNSSSPADNDYNGAVQWEWRNDNSQDVIGAEIQSYTRDVTDGTEDNILWFQNMTQGTLTEFLRFDTQSNQAIITFNENSNDIDFRVESNGNSKMFFVDGGNDAVIFNGDSSDYEASSQMVQIHNAGLHITSGYGIQGGVNADRASINLTSGASGHIVHKINNSEIARITSTGLGIGTTSPSQMLDISGTNPVMSFIETDQSNKTYNIGSFGSAFAIYDSTAGAYRMIVENGGNVVFNEGGSDCNFRIESDSNANMFKLDAGNNAIGIGSDPISNSMLHIKQASSGQNSVSANSEEFVIEDDDNCGMTILSGTGNTGTISFGDSGDDNIGQVQYHHAENSLKFVVGANERFRVTQHGAFGINTTSPTAKLHTITADTTEQAAKFDASSGSYGGDGIVRIGCARANTTSYEFMRLGSSNFADVEYLFRGDGNAYADNSWNGGGADYGEYFEWKDGNSSDEDRRGYPVILDGNKIVKATDSDDASKIIGIISGNPAIVGDGAYTKWNDKYQKDDFGTYLRDENGERLLNTDYDETKDYVPRENRNEWDVVGLMGKLRLRKGQPTGTNWIKMRDISDSVEEWLVR